VTEADVAVVGVGVLGAATSFALASQGLDVVALEQFGVGHTRGSSHGTSRIFRLVYDDARFVRLAREALVLWREVEEGVSETLIEHTGSLDIGGDLTAHRAALRAEGVEFESPSADELRRRFPLLRLPDRELLFQEDGGIVHAGRALRTLLRLAQKRGLRLLEETRVETITTDGAGVTIQAGRASIRAGAVVVAAGAWAAPLLARLGVELAVQPTRETVAYFRLGPGQRLCTVYDHAAPTAEEHSLPRGGRGAYALPAPGVGLKVGLHQTGGPADPDEEGRPDPEAVRAAAAWAASRYDLADPSPVSAETCLYTNTVDDSFSLERHGRIVLGSACSGHGFKFAPVLGRQLAGLAREALDS